MKRFITLFALAALVTIGLISIEQSHQTDSFEEWKKIHGFPFEPSEQKYRRIIFQKNVAQIEKHNADSTQTYTMGVNQFTIYTQQQFKQRFLSEVIAPGTPIQQVDEVYEIPGAIDWTAQGRVSRIKNQGSCGSCWAFASTGVMQSWYLMNGRNNQFSEQQLVDCTRDLGNMGCSGGYPAKALGYIQSHGICAQSQYTYVGREQGCKQNGGSFRVSGVSSVGGCSGLANGIYSRPLAIFVDATNWSTYRSGVFGSCAASINHCVLLVGINAAGDWLVKNSWGTSWGINGFIVLAPGNTCGVCNYGGLYVQ